MKSSNAVAVSLTVAGLLVSSSVFALPGFTEKAPRSSIESCVAEISEQANYQDAGRVRHEVDSKKRPVSGHKIMIDTTVFGADGEVVIRAYKTFCAVSDKAETKRFTIKEKSV